MKSLYINVEIEVKNVEFMLFNLIVFWYSGLSMFFGNGYNDGGLSIIHKIMDI